MDLSQDALFEHVRSAATAITTYYGRFPVERARVLIVPVRIEAELCRALHGATWQDGPA